MRVSNHLSKSKTICVFCLEHKTKMRKIFNEDKVTDFLPNYYADIFPQVVCTACAHIYSKYIEFNDPKSKQDLIKKISDKPHVDIKLRKRRVGKTVCECFFCEFLKKKYDPANKNKKLLKNPTKQPRIKVHAQGTLCGGCLSNVKLKHKCRCNNRTFIRNVLQLCKERGIEDQVLCSLLRAKAATGKANHLLELNSRKNRKIKILYNYKRRSIAKKDLIHFRQSISGSGRKNKRSLKLIRKSLGRNVIDKNLLKSMDEDVKYHFI